jgi:hypothetical protein
LKYNRKARKSLHLSETLGKERYRNALQMRRKKIAAQIILALGAITTFVAFLILDPNPSLLLASCAAVNVAIMIWAIYRLYRLDLLLSPMMLVYVGPAMILYYSWGNLGARIAGDSRFAALFGTLDYYPEVALLSTIGLILFCWIIFGVFQESFRHIKIRYQDLHWQPRQVLAAIILGLIILFYLSTKYSFTNGYFRNAESHFDRWLIASIDAFVYLLVIISVSVAARCVDTKSRLVGITGIVLSIVLALGFRSRTFMLMVLILVALCWLTMKPKQVRFSFFFLMGSIGIIIFSLGTAVKSMQGETNSIVGNLTSLSSLTPTQIMFRTRDEVGTDRQYRTGGFEYAAAILQCLDHGAQPAYGQGIMGAALQGLPGFLRPTGIINERGNISIHFQMYCASDISEAMAIPLVSGIGDWGRMGVLIYILLGVFCLLLWRVAQISPRLFIAYLLVPVYPDSLFWTGIFTYAKTMIFLWIVLWMMGPLLLPTWLPPKDN